MRHLPLFDTNEPDDPPPTAPLARRAGHLHFRPQHRGIIYAVRAGALTKIGFTARPLEARLREYATYHPELEVVMALPGDRTDERAVLHAFSGYHVAGEWFRLPGVILDLMRCANTSVRLAA